MCDDCNSFFVACGHTSENFFFHLDEKIILCSQKCDLESFMKYDPSTDEITYPGE